MSTIIAGHFEQQSQAEAAIRTLRQEFPPELITSFYVSPAGQHDLYPVGGDRDKSPGAEATGAGAATGIAVGIVVGAATSPVTGPAGPMVGAYVGSLVGGLASAKDEKETRIATDIPAIRKAGMLVASVADDPRQQQRAIELLRAQGAAQVERAEGTIERSDWIDFDPLSPPQLIRQ